ncbi:MAG: hypothetical protein ACKO32_16330 [Planctomycetia bacterium]
MGSRHKRRIKLIQPRLQLKLVGTFCGLTLLALGLQLLVFLQAISRIAEQLPADHGVLMDAVPTLVWQSSALALLIVLPLVLFVGILVTFRIAGPLYRIEKHLRSLIAGEDPGECRLRKGDELQSLCGLVNRATEEVRLRNAVERGSEDRKAA